MNKIIPLFHMSVGDVLRIGLMGVFVVICIALAIIILMQESKQNGLSGTISGTDAGGQAGRTYRSDQRRR